MLSSSSCLPTSLSSNYNDAHCPIKTCTLSCTDLFSLSRSPGAARATHRNPPSCRKTRGPRGSSRHPVAKHTKTVILRGARLIPDHKITMSLSPRFEYVTDLSNPNISTTLIRGPPDPHLQFLKSLGLRRPQEEEAGHRRRLPLAPPRERGPDPTACQPDAVAAGQTGLHQAR